MHSVGTLDKTYLGVKQLKINRTVLQFYIFIMLIDLLFIIKNLTLNIKKESKV